MKTLFLAGCLLAFTNMHAQKRSLCVSTKPGLSYFGNQSQDYQSYYLSNSKGRSTFRTAINALYHYQLSSKWGVAAGLEYAAQGQNIRMYSADVVQTGYEYKDLEIELNYLRIPLQLDYSFFQKNTSSLHVYTGISVGLATQRKDNFTDVKIEGPAYDEDADEGRYNKTDFAVPLGLNYKNNLNSKIYLQLGVEYLLGLTNTSSDFGKTSFPATGQQDHSRQSRLALNLGLGFTLGE